MTIETEPPRSRRGLRIAAFAAGIAAFSAIVAIVRLRAVDNATIRLSLIIDRPVDEVFAFVSDARNVLEWLPVAVERRKITEGPIGVGTRFEATDRMAGRLITHTQEIVAFEQDQRVTTRLSEPWNGDYEIRVEPIDGGTLLSVDSASRPSGLFRLASLMPASVMQGQFEQDYARLKDRLESGDGPATIGIEPEAEPISIEPEEVPTT